MQISIFAYKPFIYYIAIYVKVSVLYDSTETCNLLFYEWFSPSGIIETKRNFGCHVRKYRTLKLDTKDSHPTYILTLEPSVCSLALCLFEFNSFEKGGQEALYWHDYKVWLRIYSSKQIIYVCWVYIKCRIKEKEKINQITNFFQIS